MKLGAFAFACLLLTTAAAVAQGPSNPPLNNPDAASLTVYGASGTVVDDAKVPGGKAFRVNVAAKGANPWDAAESTAVRSPVKAGDELLLSFWARLAEGENGATSATLPWNAVSLASAPWTPLFGEGVSVGPEWKLYEVRGKADKDYAAGALQAGIQVASGKQVIDFGPVSVAKGGGGTTAAAQPAPAPAPTPAAAHARPKASVLASLDPAKIPSMIINDPGAPTVNGAKSKLIDDARVTGDKALRVHVPGKGKNAWDSSLSSAVTKPVKSGDNLLLLFWARLEQGENGASTATLPWNSIGMTSPPWSGVLGEAADIGPEWKQIEIKGKADKDYAGGTLGASLQLATAKQTVDLGPVIVLNLGQ
jgi:hypothetical protein